MKTERLKKVGSNLYTKTLRKILEFQMSYGHCIGSGSVGHCSGDVSNDPTTIYDWKIGKGTEVEVRQVGSKYFSDENFWLKIKTTKTLSGTDSQITKIGDEYIISFPDNWKMKKPK